MSEQEQTAQLNLEELLADEQLLQEIEQLLDRRATVEDAESEDGRVEVIAENHSYRYGKLVKSRQLLSSLAAIFFLYCSLETFHPLLLGQKLPSLGVGISLGSIIIGSILIILLILEIFFGAGLEIEYDLLQNNQLVIDYKFVPSLNRLPILLLFILLVFLTIITGFSSLYADIYRQNPEHISGLRDGLLALYFTLITFSTVGYGDIYPVTLVAKTVVMAEVFIAMFFNLVALSITLSWVAANERQHQEDFFRERLQESKKRRARLSRLKFSVKEKRSSSPEEISKTKEVEYNRSA